MGRVVYSQGKVASVLNYILFQWDMGGVAFYLHSFLTSAKDNNKDNIYLLQFGCYPVAGVI